jgi:hypothetical protein
MKKAYEAALAAVAAVAAVSAADMRDMRRCSDGRLPCCTRSLSAGAVVGKQALRDCPSLVEGRLRGVVRDTAVAGVARRRF